MKTRSIEAKGASSGTVRRSVPRTGMHCGLLASATFCTVMSTVLLAFDAMAQTPFPGGTWIPGPATYGAATERHFVVMSDGAQIAVDVRYPTLNGVRATGSFPVIMTQSPYSPSAEAGDYFVQRGYIYATMRVRGTSGSGGVFDWYGHDGSDGAAVVQWTTTLPNSSGVVGLHGNSYAGINQFYTISALGPNSPVKAAQASCTGADFFKETFNTSGIPTQTLNFANTLGGLGGAAGTAIANYIFSQTKFGGPLAYYGDFWKFRTPGEYVQRVAAANIPILLWSSSNDVVAQSSLTFYTYLQNAYAGQPIYGPMNKNIAPTPRIQINWSQGGHCANEDRSVQLQWFDQWLKGIDTGVTHTAMPIHVNEVLSNRWFSTSHYPVVPTYTKYYLDTAGVMSPSMPAGAGQETIAWAQPSAISTVQYDGPVLPNGGHLAGHMSASVYASSTTRNLQLIATLQSVAANGTATTLTKGFVLGSMVTTDPSRSWSDSDGTPILPYQLYDMDRYVPAGTVRRYDFWISPRFVQLPAGSKLRVVFTTQTPSNTCGGSLGVDPCIYTMPQLTSLSGSQVTLHHGPAASSSINLPLLPAGCWRYAGNPTAPTPTIPQWGPTDPAVPNFPTLPCQQ